MTKCRNLAWIKKYTNNHNTSHDILLRFLKKRRWGYGLIHFLDNDDNFATCHTFCQVVKNNISHFQKIDIKSLWKLKAYHLQAFIQLLSPSPPFMHLATTYEHSILPVFDRQNIAVTGFSMAV